MKKLTGVISIIFLICVGLFTGKCKKEISPVEKECISCKKHKTGFKAKFNPEIWEIAEEDTNFQLIRSYLIDQKGLIEGEDYASTLDSFLVDTLTQDTLYFQMTQIPALSLSALTPNDSIVEIGVGGSIWMKDLKTDSTESFGLYSKIYTYKPNFAAGKSVYIKGNSQIEGIILADEKIVIQGSPSITGKLWYGEELLALNRTLFSFDTMRLKAKSLAESLKINVIPGTTPLILNNKDTTFSNGEYYFSDIILHGNSNLKLNNATINCRILSMSGNSSIEVVGGPSVIKVLSGTKFTGNSMINGDLRILIDSDFDDTVKIAGNVNIQTLLLCANNAYVKIRGNVKYKGSILGRIIDISGNPQIIGTERVFLLSEPSEGETEIIGTSNGVIEVRYLRELTSLPQPFLIQGISACGAIFIACLYIHGAGYLAICFEICFSSSDPSYCYNECMFGSSDPWNEAVSDCLGVAGFCGLFKWRWP